MLVLVSIRRGEDDEEAERTSEEIESAIAGRRRKIRLKIVRRDVQKEPADDRRNRGVMVLDQGDAREPRGCHADHDSERQPERPDRSHTRPFRPKERDDHHRGDRHGVTSDGEEHIDVAMPFVEWPRVRAHSHSIAELMDEETEVTDLEPQRPRRARHPRGDPLEKPRSNHTDRERERGPGTHPLERIGQELAEHHGQRGGERERPHRTQVPITDAPPYS